MPTAPSPRHRPKRAGLSEHDGRHDTVLVILDMISCWRFPDGAQLEEQAVLIAPCLARLGAVAARLGRL